MSDSETAQWVEMVSKVALLYSYYEYLTKIQARSYRGTVMKFDLFFFKSMRTLEGVQSFCNSFKY